MRILQAFGPLGLSVDTCVFCASPGATVLEYYTPSIKLWVGILRAEPFQVQIVVVHVIQLRVLSTTT